MSGPEVAAHSPQPQALWAGAIRVLAAWRAKLRRATESTRPAVPAPPARALEVRRLLAAGSPEAVLLDTRRGVALVLAYRALAIAADRAPPSERLGAEAETAFRRSVRGRP